MHDPVVFRSGRFLARVVAETPPPTAPDAGKKPLALDMGTGSGIAAIFAARRGYRVVGVDINPVATRCARANVLMNDLQDAVDILQGDLFAPVRGTRFDLVTFNPPFFRGEPHDLADTAWRSPNILERFAMGLTTALRPAGRALIVFSSDGDEASLLNALHANGFVTTPVQRRDLRNEVLTVYAATRSTPSEPT